ILRLHVIHVNLLLFFKILHCFFELNCHIYFHFLFKFLFLFFTSLTSFMSFIDKFSSLLSITLTLSTNCSTIDSILFFVEVFKFLILSMTLEGKVTPTLATASILGSNITSSAKPFSTASLADNQVSLDIIAKMSYSLRLVFIWY